MWNKPWTLKEGFLIGGGLIVAGLMLELSVGPVVWDAFAWPVNIVVLAVMAALALIAFAVRRQVYAFRFLGSSQAAVPALCYAVVLTIIMGLTRQTVGGVWLNNILTFWPFVLVYVWLAVILSQVILRRAVQCLLSFSGKRQANHQWMRDILFMLNHLGLLIALVCGTLGNPDMQRLKMITAVGEPEWRALGPHGSVVEMPIAIELKRFIMETYDDGSPSRFASEIQILTQSGKNIQTTVDVNKPIDVDGWKIYQYGYDTRLGADSRTSILELVSDPWLPAVYVGIYMMLAGAVLMLLMQLWQVVAERNRWLIGLLVVVTAAILIFRPSYRIDHLMPALQSPWFAPHVLIYMGAYSLLGVAVILSVYGLLKDKGSVKGSLKYLVYIGEALITVGMLFGALWAKEAWGHYWSWDPKETWAAITWFSYLGYIHYRLLPRHRHSVALWSLIVAFALLQMTWWGINYLPSAQGSSVHTYNT